MNLDIIMIGSKISWDVRYSCYFEPTFIESGFLDSYNDAKPPFAVEGRSVCAETHLA